MSTTLSLSVSPCGFPCKIVPNESLSLSMRGRLIDSGYRVCGFIEPSAQSAARSVSANRGKTIALITREVEARYDDLRVKYTVDMSLIKTQSQVRREYKAFWSGRVNLLIRLPCSIAESGHEPHTLPRIWMSTCLWRGCTSSALMCPPRQPPPTRYKATSNLGLGCASAVRVLL